MGSSAGWKDAVTLGGASAQRKAARAQQQAAEEYARQQEEIARAQRAQQLAPVSVTPTTRDPMQNSETRVDTSNKRKRTISSTADIINQRSLGWTSRLG